MRKCVREDFMKEFKESGRILKLSRLGESLGRQVVREDFMKEFKELGRIIN